MKKKRLVIKGKLTIQVIKKNAQVNSAIEV